MVWRVTVLIRDGRRDSVFKVEQSSPLWVCSAVDEQWAGLPVGAVVLGSFVEAVGWQTQQRGAAQEGMRAARDRK